jgi:hypothetical protein
MSFATVVARLHRHRPATASTPSQLPRSQVAVLADEQHLREAIERAVSFERGVALCAVENVSRYERMARKDTFSEAPAAKVMASLDTERTPQTG